MPEETVQIPRDQLRELIDRTIEEPQDMPSPWLVMAVVAILALLFTLLVTTTH